MKLTPENYHTPEANNEYWSVSMFKAFKDCEAAGLAMLRGEYERSTSAAFLQGSYVDAHFSGSMDVFLAEHPEVLNSRTGALKADYQKARAAIERAEHDELFMEYMSGASQVIMTGEVFGERWKIKVDKLSDDKIVDLKYMRNMESIYRDGEWKTFIDAYGYDVQGFIYQQVVLQNTGSMLPFYLAVITKEDAPDIELIHIPDWKLNSAGSMIKYWISEFADVKAGRRAPKRCSHCEYCRSTKKLTKPIEYDTLLEGV